jgi:hypothetical protein
MAAGQQRGPRAGTRGAGMKRTASRTLFGLNDDSAAHRGILRAVAFGSAWLILSGFTMLLTFFGALEFQHRFILLIMSFVKYIPILAVLYFFARRMAAHYLDDIYELRDENLAAEFIENVAFGHAREKIIINEGRISPEDERSPIILIGGPGEIQVNLDSVALLEQVDGDPEIVSPRSEPWKIERFERIREIGVHDEVGKREYAIINLRDQLITGLKVKSRTRDGIPLEVNDIKVISSILRPERTRETQNQDYLFSERAVRDLVYKQTLISPPPSTPGVGFPWDTTVVPLVVSELEDLITSRTLSEILASISQKDVDQTVQFDETIAQMRVEITGQQTVIRSARETSAPNFESRSKITAQFFTPEFREKAAALGVQIDWIDIGTWQLPFGMIQDNLKDAWNLTRENAKKRSALETASRKHETEEFFHLLESIIFSNYEKAAPAARLTEKELQEIEKLIKESPEVAFTPSFARRMRMQPAGKPDAHAIALEMLKAFRKELLSAKSLLEKENKFSLEEQERLARINKALRDISHHTAHFIRSSR